MAERNSGRATSHRLEVSSPEQVRNVVLVGPSQSGKTSLAEALLLASGAVTRGGTIAEHNTVCDFEDGERAHERSSSLAVAPVVHAGCKINVIDTPGYADFVGEVRAGLRAADCALFVVAANEAVDESTRQLWRECEAVTMPRAVVVTKLDHARADFDGTLRGVREAFGERVLPVVVPSEDGVTGLLGGSVDDDRRGTLIEAVIEESEDESLMDRYLDGGLVDEDLLVKDLETAVASARLHPVLAVCGTDGRGCTELLDLCVRGFPSPAEHPAQESFTPSGAGAGAVTCDPDGPLVAEVVRTSSDQYVGRVSIVRVFSGTLVPDASVHVSGHFSAFFAGDSGHEDHDEDERIGALAHPFGAHQVPAARVVAGDIAAIGRLSRAETGDTLSSPEQPRVLKPWTMPTALLPVAIEAASRSDEDKLSTALGRLRAEDPSLRIEQNAETGQVVLWVMGEAHADQALDRLRSRYGVAVEPREVVVPLRETFTSPAKGHGRHVKQSGGHGQYAICDIEVEPLPQGGGFEFVDKVVGGAVPRQFIGSVEKGVRAQMERGVTKGYPVVDLRVTLTDGKAHSVDSSDAAFQSAGALALREAADAAELALLEPYDEVEVLIPSEHVGSVMSDLSARRGRLLGTEEGSDERTLVRAHVPQTELVRYAIDLRATTHGAGTFTRTFAHYEPMPDELARRVEGRG
ncbi:elongation factor G-like protein EF-G2 [Marmoricola sp. URHB0036]|uniref:elongation factor G-like protein EF-G2 n=1 Tax=Marmoricola sp. URHB0036 TaxID=1298863 RepID=UPI00040F816B|nr:elongation factor G-like protein EF-G2 [Marmoricola sp. URHB0036]